ncbi:MAG: helix-turn-helix transcriptional regulator [Actinobacteria bacterium]|nr:helix-turn-helix transcriptional regulator [Actinomycetota bacterium]
MDASALLRNARARAGLTQAELARRAGTSQATVSAYEHGRKTPSVETLGRLLAAAGARLTAVPASTTVVRPSKAQLARAGRGLVDVMLLAEALPTRHDPELRFPPLTRFPARGAPT